MRRAAVLIVATWLSVSTRALAADANYCTYPAEENNGDVDPHRDDRIGVALIESKVQHGRLATGTGPSSTCAQQDSTPAIIDPERNHYFTNIRFRNYASVAACISVTVYPDATGSSPRPFSPYQVLAYAGAFDPNDLQANYLGAVHGAPDIATFSFNAAASSDFEVVINGDYAGNEYGLFVGGCGQPRGFGATMQIETGELLIAPNDAGTTSKTSSRTDLSPASPDPPSDSAEVLEKYTVEQAGGCNASGGSSSGAVALLGAVALIATRRRRRRR